MFFVLQLSTLLELSQSLLSTTAFLFARLVLVWLWRGPAGERSYKWIHNRDLGLCARACSDRPLAPLVSRVISSTIAETFYSSYTSSFPFLFSKVASSRPGLVLVLVLLLVAPLRLSDPHSARQPLLLLIHVSSHRLLREGP